MSVKFDKSGKNSSTCLQTDLHVAQVEAVRGDEARQRQRPAITFKRVFGKHNDVNLSIKVMGNVSVIFNHSLFFLPRRDSTLVICLLWSEFYV